MDGPDIAQAVIENKKKDIKVWPQHKNRCSEAGHPCEQYLVLCRTNWRDRTPHDVGLQFIFDRGNAVEKVALDEIEAAGFKVVEGQRPFEWKELELTGSIDGRVSVDGGLYPLEVKALTPYAFPGLNTIEDFINSNRLWMRKYPAQLMLYLLMAGEDRGVFYIKNGLNWWPKCIWVDLDYEYADGICKKLERVNAHIFEGTPGTRLDDAEVCPECPFFHICLPEIKRDALEITDDPEVVRLLERREELSPLASEYKKVDDELKKILEGKERVVVGDFLITGKYTDKKGFTVEPSVYWRKSIKRIEGGGGNA